jgi:hypothetical protein
VLVNDANANTLCGFSSGWRIPDQEELYSIVHLGKTSGARIDEDYFPNTQSDWYWSSSLYFSVSGNSEAWRVHFGVDEGSDGESIGTASHYVRLVNDGKE